MARRPRNNPRDQASTRSVEVTDKEILRYDSHNRRLKMRIQLNGVDYKQIARNVQVADDGMHQEILNLTAENMRQVAVVSKAQRSTEEIKDGTGDWASRPEGIEKQHIAQNAMRDVVEYARRGKELQKDGRTRPDAFAEYAKTRNLKNKIWDELDYIGNHVDKAAYLALEGPGDGTEYGELNQYMNDLEAAASDWNAVVNFMATCTKPKQIDTEVTV